MNAVESRPIQNSTFQVTPSQTTSYSFNSPKKVCSTFGSTAASTWRSM
jgi:hypothetical protein